jgi:hypothetical protein
MTSLIKSQRDWTFCYYSIAIASYIHIFEAEETGYMLHGRRSEVLFQAGAKNLSVLHSVQTCCGIHRASLGMGIGEAKRQGLW